MVQEQLSIFGSRCLAYRSEGVKRMSVQEFELGDIAECPNCEKEFELKDSKEDEPDSFDEYFEHITTCG